MTEKTEEKTGQPQTLGGMIDGYYDLREKKQALEADIKEIKRQMADMEMDLIHMLDEQDTTMSRGKSATAVLTEVDVPKVDDWDAFYSYIDEHEAFHLLQRRPATASCRELLEAGEEIPGVSTFLKRSISLRKKS